MPRPELSLVIPIYNEAEVLPQLDVRLKELLEKLAIDTEVVFVNDGSRDGSLEILRRMASHELRYKVISFSRNFGHQRAITAGMDKSRGRAVVVMDADLQDPPEVILEMVEKWRQGYDVVYGRRRSRAGESWFKLITAKIFYRVFAAMIPIEVPLDTGDFRLMSRRVVTTMRGLRETHRFVRGLVAWVGFKQTAVEYDRAPRAAGETKYPLRKMIAFAMDGIASFSIQPLRFATYVGVVVGAASVLYGLGAIISKLLGMTVPGWTTTVVLVSFLFSVQFFMIGVLGEYVGRIYEQVKGRPLYIVSERINFGRRKVEHLATKDIEEVLVPGTPPLPAVATGAIATSKDGPASTQGPRVPSTGLPSSPPVPGAAKPLAPKLPSSVSKVESGARSPSGTSPTAGRAPSSLPPRPAASSAPPRASVAPAPTRTSTSAPASMPPRAPSLPLPSATTSSSKRPPSTQSLKAPLGTKPSGSSPLAKTATGAPPASKATSAAPPAKTSSMAPPGKTPSASPPAGKTPSDAPPASKAASVPPAGKTPSVPPASRDPKELFGSSKEPAASGGAKAQGESAQGESAEARSERFSSMPTKVAPVSSEADDEGDATRVEPNPLLASERSGAKRDDEG